MEESELEALRKSMLETLMESVRLKAAEDSRHNIRLNFDRYDLIRSYHSDDLFVLLDPKIIDKCVTAVEVGGKVVFSEHNFPVSTIESFYKPTDEDFTPLELPAAIGSRVWHREWDATRECHRYEPCILEVCAAPGCMTVRNYLYDSPKNVPLSELYLLKEDEVKHNRAFCPFV